MRAHLPTLLAPLAVTLLAACGSEGPKPDPAYYVTLRYCSASALASCTAENQNGRDDLTESQRQILESAAEKIEQVVTAGLVPGRTRDRGGPLTCYKDAAPGSAGVTMDETVHGLVVLVMVDDMSSSGILAASGPCIVRGSNGLPLVAVMRLNGSSSTSIATLTTDGRLYNVVLHELFHTLGFGTLWGPEDKKLLGGSDSDPRYTGRNALEQAKTANSTPDSEVQSWASVPVEREGGAGTMLSHWRQSVFSNYSSSSAPWELMTGRIAPQGIDEPLSATTLGAIRDLGYHVDFGLADDFTIPNPDLTASMAALRAPVEGELTLGDDVLRLPISRTDD